MCFDLSLYLKIFLRHLGSESHDYSQIPVLIVNTAKKEAKLSKQSPKIRGLTEGSNCRKPSVQSCPNKSSVESKLPFLRCPEATGTKYRSCKSMGQELLVTSWTNEHEHEEVENSCQKRNPCSSMEEIMSAMKTGQDFEWGLMFFYLLGGKYLICVNITMDILISLSLKTI